MSRSKISNLFKIPTLRGDQTSETQGRAPEVRLVRKEEIGEGRAAPVPSPALMFRHSGPPLPGVHRDDGAPPKARQAGTPSSDSVASEAATPDSGRVHKLPEPAKPEDLKHLSREEIRAIRNEERRIKRVLEGRAPPRPGDPVPDAPQTLKQRKETRIDEVKKKRSLGAIKVAPVARAASMRLRHWGVLISFLMIVILPLCVVGWYLATRAVDQYASISGFTVRSEDGNTNNLLTGIAASISGGATQTDTDILYEFIQSQSLVNSVNERFDLRTLYSGNYDRDPVFSIYPEATSEDLLDYWKRIVTVSYDSTSGLIEMRVKAFDPATSQRISQAILDESQILINDLNAQARADKLSYSLEDLEKARDRLRETREALIVFRTRTQIVDPLTDLQGRLGVVTSLQQQLAEALIEQDLLREQTNTTDPRYVQVRRKIEVIRERIDDERASVASGGATTVEDEAYPELLAEYEGLLADREFAEESYRVALAAHDLANAAASRQTRYLATYVRPTLPETAEYPQRWISFGLTFLFLMLAWSIAVLIYYSIRDSK